MVIAIFGLINQTEQFDKFARQQCWRYRYNVSRSWSSYTIGSGPGHLPIKLQWKKLRRGCGNCNYN
jgi:hypothetical protein